MAVDSESFRGKLYLLVIDKLVIGAIVAIAFVVYDQWRTNDVRSHEAQAKQVQLEFERSKLVREFLPVITDTTLTPVARAYVLRSAIVTGSLAPDAGIELGRDLLSAGLEDEHFVRVMTSALPQGLHAVTRNAVRIGNRWQERTGTVLWPTTFFDPESGREKVPREVVGLLREVRLWQRVLLEALPSVEVADSLWNWPGEAAELLPGLFILMIPGTQSAAMDLSVNEARPLRLIGNIARVFFDPMDSSAANGIGTELLWDRSSFDGIRYSQAILGILTTYGPPAGNIALPISQLATDEGLPRTAPLSMQEADFWLRWKAGELLVMMQRTADTTLNSSSEPVLQSYIQAFADKLSQASTPTAIDSLSSAYEGGKILRLVIESLGHFKTPSARITLQSVLAIGSEKLHHFPFLEDALERALSFAAP